MGCLLWMMRWRECAIEVFAMCVLERHGAENEDGNGLLVRAARYLSKAESSE